MNRGGRDHDYIYGLNPVAETLRGMRKHSRLLVRSDRRDDRRVAALVTAAANLGVPVVELEVQALDRFASGGNHQGVVLETGRFNYTDLDEILSTGNGRPILVLDRLKDPQNLATLIRTAAAVDVAGIVIESDRSVSVTPAVVRSSAGLVEHVQVARENNTRRALESIKASGYWAVALELTDSSEDMFSADIPLPTALVVGAEERGVTPTVLKACDLVVSLPMPGRAESLNAAIAGSVGLFELLRRSRELVH